MQTPFRWLLLPIIALWPIWWWMATRMTDGSDDPLGIMALFALVLLILRDRKFLALPTKPIGMVVVLLFAVLSTISSLPWLVRAVFSVISVMSLLTMLNRRSPMVAHWGLGFLALPILSSLHFFVGYPLRVITAEASALILNSLGIIALRAGSSLEVAGHLIIVDAPCSGIQMAWIAYFTACTTAAWLRIPNTIFLRRAAFVGVIVLIGNIVRNTLLVVKESQLIELPDWTHTAIGLATFIIVNGLVLWLIARPILSSLNDQKFPLIHTKFMQKESAIKSIFHNAGNEQSDRYKKSAINSISSNTGNEESVNYIRLYTKLKVFRDTQKYLMSKQFKIGVICTIMLTLFPIIYTPSNVALASNRFVEWPHMLGGKNVRPLALSTIEQRFSENFPGAIVRLTDEESVYILRQINQPTRKLHAATDCFQGLGFTISDIKLVRIALTDRSDKMLSRCFTARKKDEQLQVCEQIIDQNSQSYTDTSSWYWSAVFGKTTGPWRSITRVEIL